MADVHDKVTRSHNMRQIRSKGTKPEKIVRKFLFANGFRYRLNVKALPGKPDIVLPKYKVIVLIHGCFWHGHENCRLFRLPQTRSEWWSQKIERTKMRDQNQHQQLVDLGWEVIIVRECELRSPNRRATLVRIMTRILDQDPISHY